MSEQDMIQVEKIDKVGLITLNRPKALNALNPTLLHSLMDTLEAFDKEEDIGAMVITGSETSFAAGADIKDMVSANPIEMMMNEFIPAFARIREIKKPIIAAVSGYCLGGGNELALSCDMIVASETASFGQPEINLGIIPGAGGTQRLTKAVGKALAMEMVLNNRTLSAQEALDYHLVNYVEPIDSYLDKAIDLAQDIAHRAPLAVQLGKESVNIAFETHLQRGLEEERRVFYLLFSSKDQEEGMKAFIEKRNPSWQGE
ncbi:MAG: enoyl-CoA hydratase-related protein [Anaerolineales bacterium]